MSDKIKISLKIADIQNKFPLEAKSVEEEALIREAAKKVNDRWTAYKERYRGSNLGSKEYLAMVALQFARLFLEASQERNTFTSGIESLENEIDKYFNARR